MQNIQNDELDDFFKKASENPNITFNPAAWTLMEKKIEAAKLRALWMRRIKYLSLVLLLITSTVITINELSGNNGNDNLISSKLAYRDNSQKALSSERNNLSKNSDSLNNTAISSSHLQEENRSKIASESYGAIIDSNIVANNAKRKGYLNHGLKESEGNKSFVIEESNKIISKNNFGYPISNSKVKKTDIHIRPTKALDKEVDDIDNWKKVGATSNNKSNFELDSQKDSNQKRLNAQLPIIGKRDAYVSNDTLIYGEIIKRQTVSNNESDEQKKEESILPLLRLRGLMSPDFSSALGISQVKTGYNIGFALEYFFFKNISIEAGVLQSQKVYSADPENYNPSPTYWNGKKLPDEIDGNCSVIDIPVNVKYYLLGDHKWKGFGSLGLSTYLMRKEAYTYMYPTYQKTWRVSKENNHYFSVVNLSAGLEYRIGKRFSLGFEPFLKVPVTEIGAGKIKLKTGGAFLSINYILLKR